MQDITFSVPIVSLDDLVAGPSEEENNGHGSNIDWQLYASITYDADRKRWYGSTHVSNQLGIHARPSSAIVNHSSRYNMGLFMRNDYTGSEMSSKSMLSFLTLVAAEGIPVTVSAEAHSAEDFEGKKAVYEILNYIQNVLPVIEPPKKDMD